MTLDLRTHEIVERRMVARYVQPGDLVLECGGGIGAVTRVLLDAGACVTTYEPGALQFYDLKQLAAVYPACAPQQAALADHDGEIPLHCYDDEVWFADRTTSLGGHVPIRTVTVRARSFYDELAREPWTGLVLDIEGAEHALLAAARFPPSLRWIVAELHGPPDQLARTLAAVTAPFRLDAIEVNQVYLVVGWTRCAS